MYGYTPSTKTTIKIFHFVLTKNSLRTNNGGYKKIILKIITTELNNDAKYYVFVMDLTVDFVRQRLPPQYF